MFRSTRPHPSRFRRGKRSGVALAGAVALTAAALVVPATSASAAPLPVTIITSVNAPGGASYVNEPTSVSFQVTNPSTTKLGLFSIVVPKSVTAVAKGPVTSTTVGGWNETKLPCGATANCSAVILVSASLPLSKSLVGPGSVTASITFTPTATGMLSFPFLGIGGRIFKVATTPTVLVGTHAAVSVHVTSIADTSTNPPLPVPVVGGSFAVSFTAADQFGNPAVDTYTLSAPNAVGGTLTSLPPSPSALNASYSAPQYGLTLRVTSSGGAFGEGGTAVITAGTSSAGGVGTDIQLALPGASADLSNGSTGPVFLTTQPCTPGVDTCGATTPVEITLSGNFKDAAGHPLYGFGTEESPLAPASLTWTCSATDCPHFDGESPIYKDNYQYNYDNPEADEEREVVEDYTLYPTYLSLQVDGVYQPFAKAVPCVDPNDLATTGVIKTAAAQAAKFCVDVNAITRSDANGVFGGFQSFHGAIKIPVLFVEDPKLRHAP